MLRFPKPIIDRLLLLRLTLVRAVTRAGLSTSLIFHRFGEVLLWIGFYLAVAVLGLIPGPMAGQMAGVFWLGLLIFAWRGFANTSGATRPDTDRAIEAASRIAHRPLQLHQDELFNAGRNETQALWQQAQYQARAQLNRLRIAAPAPFWVRLDPLALRAPVILLLVAGLVMAGGESTSRVLHSLWPWAVFNSRAVAAPMISRLEFIPPPYTGQAPVTMTTGATPETINLLPGTIIRATTTSDRLPVFLMMDWSPYLLNEQDTIASREIIIPIGSTATTVSLWRGLSLELRVPVVSVTDTAPDVAISALPASKPDGTIDIPITYRDDFGLTELRVTVTAPASTAPMSNPLAGDEMVDVPINLPGGPEEKTTTINIDLSSSYRAGMDASLQLRFRDYPGHEVNIPVFNLTLPRRHFNNPVARQIASLRDDLIARGFGDAEAVATVLSAMLRQPKLFKNDVITVLSIKIAAERLAYTRESDDLRSVIDLLWQGAIRLEDGGADLRTALNRLSTAQNRLMQMLQDPATSDADLQDALSEMQQALAETMRTLMERMQAQQNPDMMRMMEQLGAMKPKTMDMDMLGDFLRQLQHEIASGNRDKAREMLQQLQKFAERLKNPMTAMPPDIMDMMKLVEDIQQLIVQQRNLRDDTERAARTMAQGQDVRTGKQAAAQNDLLNKLGDIMTEMGQKLPMVPQNFGNAQNAMRAASSALNKDLPRLAVPDQDAAIEELQKNQSQMGQQLMQRLQQMMMVTMPDGSQGMTEGGQNSEPGENGQQSEDFTIPEVTREHLRQILKTLRDRAGQGEGNRDHRDYFERLLRQY